MDAKLPKDEAGAEVARILEICFDLATQLGTVSELERAMGEGNGFFQKRISAGDLRASQLARAGWALGVRLRLPMREPGLASLPLLAHRKRKCATLTAVELAAEAALKCTRPGFSPEELEARLEVIDDLRWESPLDALDLAESACYLAAPGQVPHFLAAAVACFRLLHQYSAATRCVARAADLARAADDRLALGVLRQKCVYLYDALGAPEIALDLAQEAYELFSRIADDRRMGEALIDQAFCWFQLKQFPACLLALADAERHGPALGIRYRVARLKMQGNALAELGRPEEALERIHLAVAEAEGCGSNWLKAKLLWAEGKARGPAGTAQLEQAVQLLLVPLPIDALLAALDLARAHLSAGQPAAAYRVAREMTVFVQPLNRIPAACKAIRELILIGQASRGLTLRVLEEAERVIQQNRVRYYSVRKSR